jgi:transcriptional regulator with XRE-family HTH domain
MKYELKTDITRTGVRFKKIREHFGLNQKEFGARLGLVASTVSEFEAHNIHPSYGLVLKFYEVLGVNPNYILLGHGSMFLDETGRILSELDFGDQKQEAIEMILTMEQSPLVRAFALATTTHFIAANESIINNDIQKRQSLKNKQSGDTNKKPEEKAH